MTTAGDALLVERANGIATVTLNRPAQRNALSSALVLGLREALAQLDADDEVGAVVLTGSDPAFCAGLDLKELGSTGANLGLGRSPDGVPPGHRWAPLVGAVNGIAVTGGLELALHCDLLIASERGLRRHACPGGRDARLGRVRAAARVRRHPCRPADEPDGRLPRWAGRPAHRARQRGPAARAAAAARAGARPHDRRQRPRRRPHPAGHRARGRRAAARPGGSR